MAAQLAISDISATAADGLQARQHDPVWTLARQWQMGELHGEDAGSPIGARLTVLTAPIGPLKAGAAQEVGTVVPLDALHSTLEYVVEAEAWDTPRQPHARLSAELGLQLERAQRLWLRDHRLIVQRLFFRDALPLSPGSQSALEIRGFLESNLQLV